MKIKIFEFEVSNAASSPCSGDEGSHWYNECIKRLSTPSEIEDTLNYFTEQHDILFVKVNTVDIHYHNNGRGNEIKLVYTIGYEEPFLEWEEDED